MAVGFMRALAVMAAVAGLVACMTACSDEDDDDEAGPSIPHAVESSADSSCLTCHKDGTGGAPKTPHPEREECTECHHPAK